MKITTILCTYNRCQSLSKALESVAASELPKAAEWEVLVVDNNSSDQTREVVGDFCRRYPGRFRYMFEPQQGKSHALNAGIREAQGEVLAFTDDDVTVEPMWLQNLTAALCCGEWAGTGGRVLPERTFSLPRWLPLEERYALGPLAMFDLGPAAGRLTEPPFGNNMAFQKKMFDKYGGFRTYLGPCPGSEIRGEDTEFGGRLLAAGEQLRYEPSAVVYHSVPENRLQKKYFQAWWFDKARADIRASGISPDTTWFVVGIPLYTVRRLAVWALRWMVAVAPSYRFSCKLKVWGLAGAIVESYRQSCRAN
jgi:glucosyl-dolichyl phosphate glucuronosyltransferase